MRDRLIKLLDGADLFLRNRANAEPAPLNEYDIENLKDIAKVCDDAARTLEKAIIPPCKVGDKVYFNKVEIDETCPAKVIKICNNFYTPSMPLWITIEYESKLIGRYEVKMGSDVFELRCFPTKEEAEKALKGGEG